MPTALEHRGFACVLHDDVSDVAARTWIDRALVKAERRVNFFDAGGAPDRPPGGPGVCVKAEFLRPLERPVRRLRTPRCVAEACGIASFRAAGLPAPRLLLHGHQPRWWPRGGSILVTERVNGTNAAKVLRQEMRADVCDGVARVLAEVHGRGFVHGDAALRNFVVAPERTWVVDLPRWRPWSPGGAEDDLAHVIGSLLKAGSPHAFVGRVLAAYAAGGDAAGRLPPGWDRRAVSGGDAYVAHLRSRDESRPVRHARTWREPHGAKSQGA